MSSEVSTKRESSSTSPSLSSAASRELPPELLLQILACAASEEMYGSPIEQYHNHWAARRETLRNLCLVSKWFKSAAQPLLLAHVETWYDPKALPLLLEHNSAENLAFIRVLLMYGPERGWKHPGNFFRISFPDEEIYAKLPVHSYHSVGSNLVTMSLHDSDLSHPLKPFSFPELKHLSLTDTRYRSPEHLPRFNLPKLRHLVLIPNEMYGLGYIRPLLDCVSPTLISLSIPLEFNSSLPPSVASISRCFDCLSLMFPNVPEPGPHDVYRLFIPSSWHGIAADPTEDALRIQYERPKMIREELHPLTMIVPTIKLEDEEDTTLIRDACDVLIDQCQREGVRVIREECFGVYNFWDFVSPSFIESAELRAAKKEVK